MLDWWRWDLNYSLLKTDLSNPDNIQTTVSPEHTFSLRSSINPIENVTLDFWLRHSSAATAFNPLIFGRDSTKINGYTTFDMRLAWQPIKNIELSLTGQNLLENQHVEYLDESYALPAPIPRSIYGKISWQF